jgi:XTP/dITP diphosphohydrolase
LTEAKRNIYFATTNKGKFAEAALLAEEHGVRLRHLNAEKLEIQAASLSEIACFAAEQMAKSKRRSVVVEDAGFFVDALNGFPGPYSAHVLRQINCAGILKLMRDVTNRAASFQASVAYCSPGKKAKCFTGIVQGNVSFDARGTQGFGFDPIFIPRVGDGRTFAEMTAAEKNEFSHRAEAFTKFCKWISRPTNSARVA